MQVYVCIHMLGLIMETSDINNERGHRKDTVLFISIVGMVYLMYGFFSSLHGYVIKVGSLFLGSYLSLMASL